MYAFNVNKYKGDNKSYKDEIEKASDEEITNSYNENKKKFDNAGFINNDSETPGIVAYATGRTGQTGSIEKGYRGEGRPATQLYAYPFDIDLEQDHLKITRHEYLRSSINASKPPTEEYFDEQTGKKSHGGDAIPQTVRGGSVLGNLKGSVILPMPKVTDVNAADWGKSELNAQGMAARWYCSKIHWSTRRDSR